VPARGEGNAYDTIQVRHVSGGISTLRFRTHSAGHVALRGQMLEIVWLDEEPDDPVIYGECLARVTATRGFVMIAFTPLKDMTTIALRFSTSRCRIAYVFVTALVCNALSKQIAEPNRTNTRSDSHPE
jgi:phage terminase large subunit-like protein